MQKQLTKTISWSLCVLLAAFSCTGCNDRRTASGQTPVLQPQEIYTQSNTNSSQVSASSTSSAPSDSSRPLTAKEAYGLDAYFGSEAICDDWGVLTAFTDASKLTLAQTAVSAIMMINQPAFSNLRFTDYRDQITDTNHYDRGDSSIGYWRLTDLNRMIRAIYGQDARTVTESDFTDGTITGETGHQIGYIQQGSYVYHIPPGRCSKAPVFYYHSGTVSGNAMRLVFTRYLSLHDPDKLYAGLNLTEKTTPFERFGAVQSNLKKFSQSTLNGDILQGNTYQAEMVKQNGCYQIKSVEIVKDREQAIINRTIEVLSAGEKVTAQQAAAHQKELLIQQNIAYSQERATIDELRARIDSQRKEQNLSKLAEDPQLTAAAETLAKTIVTHPFYRDNNGYTVTPGTGPGFERLPDGSPVLTLLPSGKQDCEVKSFILSRTAGSSRNYAADAEQFLDPATIRFIESPTAKGYGVSGCRFTEDGIEYSVYVFFYR